MSLRRPLTIPEILAWADIHREATGNWPTKDSGGVLGAKFETWLDIDRALRTGRRTLPGGSSLPRLLEEKRGVRNKGDRPSLTERQILQWADGHKQRTKEWPRTESGAIPDSGGDTWEHIDRALRRGLRGLAGGSSLSRLLNEHRDVRHRNQLPPFTEEKIWQWAKAHHERTNEWPHAKSGPITDSPEDTWLAVSLALQKGLRKLPGGSSLARLLAEKRGVRHPDDRPDLSIEQILTWADAFHQRMGNWPNLRSGTILESPQETWSGVDRALCRKFRGLTAGFSLARLLADQREVRNNLSTPRLTHKQIVRWAKAYFRRTGTWPTMKSGVIPEAPEETWAAINAALNSGLRGLRPAGSSLAKVLADWVGKPHHRYIPLSKRKILAWADAHYQRTGQWPNSKSGSVADAPGERWNLIDNALRLGRRTLPGGSSLLQLLVRKRGVHTKPRSVDKILR